MVVITRYQADLCRPSIAEADLAALSNSPVAVHVDEGVMDIDGGCLNSVLAEDLLLGWEREQRRLDRAS
jgi:hypothetical protein